MKLHENESRNYIRNFAYYAVFTVLLILINTIFSDKRFLWGLLIVFVWSMVILVHAAVLMLLTVRSQSRPAKQNHSGKGKGENAEKAEAGKAAGAEGTGKSVKPGGTGKTVKSEKSNDAKNSRGRL